MMLVVEVIKGGMVLNILIFIGVIKDEGIFFVGFFVVNE